MITEKQIAQNKERYLEQLSLVKRPGVDKLVQMLNETDFFTAPASMKYHCNYDGGLCEHHLNVFDAAVNLLLMKAREADMPEDATMDDLSEEFWGVKFESVILATLCHGYTKINYYIKYRGRGQDANGDWKTMDKIGHSDDPFVLGDDGTNSMWIANRYVKLTSEEALAINNCSGISNNGMPIPSATWAWKKSKLALYLHIADMIATYEMEE